MMATTPSPDVPVRAFSIAGWVTLGIWVIVALNMFIKNRDDD